MDEKTRQLRDIFMDVADDATVTERQEQSRGSLAADEGRNDQLRSVVDSMRDRYEFRTDLPTAQLVSVVRGFFDGASDAELAEELPSAPSPEAVFHARLDLHLVAETDRDAPFDLDQLRDAVDDGRLTDEVADALGESESTVRRYRQVVETDRERRAVGDRYREEFERLLADGDLGSRLTEEVRQTGLEDATEGMETNVSF